MPQEPLVSEPSAPPAPSSLGLPLTPSAEHRMRAALQEIRDIEASSLYRLTRLAGGRIVWRAPEIE